MDLQKKSCTNTDRIWVQLANPNFEKIWVQQIVKEKIGVHQSPPFHFLLLIFLIPILDEEDRFFDKEDRNPVSINH